MRREVIAYIIILILMLIFAYGLGYANGAKSMVNWGVDAVEALLKADKIDITADKEMIKNGILQYKNNIGGCLFIENASLHDN